MRNKKHVLLVVAALLVSFLLSACGSKMTIAEYYEEKEVQDTITELKETYSAQGIDVNTYVDGDNVYFEFKMQQEIPDENWDMIAEQITALMEEESFATVFQGIADQWKDMCSNEKIVLVVAYYDGGGKEIASKEYTAE